jgi:hypothetical protein
MTRSFCEAIIEGTPGGEVTSGSAAEASGEDSSGAVNGAASRAGR